MSQKELEHGDQEVLDLVNDHAHPEAEASAEEIKKDLGYGGTVGYEVPELSPKEKQMTEEVPREMKRDRSRKRREFFGVSMRVAICVAVACVLVAALFAPKLLIWIVNAGVLACGIVAALIVDRRFRRR